MKPEFLERSLQGYAERSLEQAERLSGGHADTVRVSVRACVRYVHVQHVTEGCNFLISFL